MFTPTAEINILYVGSNKESYYCTKKILTKSDNFRFNLSWSNFHDLVHQPVNIKTFDVCLVNHDIVENDDPDLIGEMERNFPALPPVISLIPENSGNPVIQALKYESSDCIYESEFSLSILDKSIRRVIQQNQTSADVFDKGIAHNAILNSITDGVVVFNEQHTIEYNNTAVVGMFGRHSNDIAGQSLNRLLPEFELDECLSFSEPGKHTESNTITNAPREFTGVKENGDTFAVEIFTTRVCFNNKSLYCGVLRDLTLRNQVDTELRLLASVFELHTALLITDANGAILRVNQALSDITGYQPYEIEGKNINILLAKDKNEDVLDTVWGSISIKDRWEGEVWGVRKNGERYPQFITITAIKTNQESVAKFIANFHDITEQKLIQSRIEHFAHYDVLTDLPNRRFLLDRLEQEISRARREQVQGGLLFCDLDNFKHINDTQGHAAGDELLQQVSKRLLEHVRTEDVVARLGGDEFVVLLPHLKGHSEESRAYAKGIAKKLQFELASPFVIEDRMHRISVSIGISMFPVDGESAKDILKQADSDMYRCKAINQVESAKSGEFATTE